MPSTHVLDLSHHNEVTSFREIADSGVVGVILKASEGTSFEDPDYRQRRHEALAAGLKVASYHFLHAGAIDQQIDWFLEVVGPGEGERLILDHEADASLAELEEAVRYLAENEANLQITVYSGHLIKEQLGDGYSDTLSTLTDLWIAHYTTGWPTWPEQTWSSPALWQWTDEGTCPGVTGNVDCNHFNGSAEMCAQWMGPVPSPEEPVPGRVSISVTLERGTVITLTINGEVTEYVAA